MEGLHKEKTAYLETLENLFHELTHARSMSSSGRKLVLLGLLYDVHRVHQFFLQIENNLSESIDIRNILKYDADVDYNEWNVKLDMKFDVKPFYMPDEVAKEADPVSVKTTLEHVFDTFSRDELKNILCDRTNKVQFMMAILMNDLSVDQLVLVLNESVVALRESLVHIQACINRHRMTLEEGKELYRHEKEIFVREHEREVEEKFEEWKDTFDGDKDVIKRNLKGKYCTEILAFFMSGFLAPRIGLQGETDTTEFETEYEEVCFYNYPKDMDLKAHYSALREIFEYKDKMIVPKKGHIGKYFFKYRKEVDAKQRIALFAFIKMIELIEEEKRPKEEKVSLKAPNNVTPLPDTMSKSLFYHIIQYENPKELVDRLHQLIDGQRGKAVGCVLLKCLQDKLIRCKPSQKEVESEFDIKGGWSGIHKYMNENDPTAIYHASQIKIF